MKSHFLHSYYMLDVKREEKGNEEGKTERRKRKKGKWRKSHEKSRRNEGHEEISELQGNENRRSRKSKDAVGDVGRSRWKGNVLDSRLYQKRKKMSEERESKWESQKEKSKVGTWEGSSMVIDNCFFFYFYY